jgi:hypothetical protein
MVRHVHVDRDRPMRAHVVCLQERQKSPLQLALVREMKVYVSVLEDSVHVPVVAAKMLV